MWARATHPLREKCIWGIMPPHLEGLPRCSQMDDHYTPKALAAKLIDSVGDIRPSVVADLCSGRGDLLFRAEERWPTADYAAVDIDRTAIRDLRRLRPQWQVGRCDLRNIRSRNSSPVLRRVAKKISLLLLNPPFSCRGGTRYSTDTPSGSLYASSAISFLITSLAYLDKTGSAVAVLPSGALYSQKDRSAWEYIHSRFSVSVISALPRGDFPGSAANVVLVRLSPHAVFTATQETPGPAPSPFTPLKVRVTRGCQAMHRISGKTNGPILVHSTDLRESRVHLNGRRGNNARRSFSGSAVLLPRVGQLTRDKIALFHSNEPIVLSDCVIGLATNSLPEASEIQRRLLLYFSKLIGQYVGTGAPFVTLERLEETLCSIGIERDDIR